MSEKKKREDYSKVGIKTAPTSIRFNAEQLKIALTKSGKKSKQQLVDFLLDEYLRTPNPVLERYLNYEEFEKAAKSKKQIKPTNGNSVKVSVVTAVLNDEKYPGRFEGESIIDYKIRTAENDRTKI